MSGMLRSGFDPPYPTGSVHGQVWYKSQSKEIRRKEKRKEEGSGERRERETETETAFRGEPQRIEVERGSIDAFEETTGQGMRQAGVSNAVS